VGFKTETVTCNVDWTELHLAMSAGYVYFVKAIFITTITGCVFFYSQRLDFVFIICPVTDLFVFFVFALAGITFAGGLIWEAVLQAEMFTAVATLLYHRFFAE
jgi:hypothetical protein